jgi:hypothetical protein
MKELIIIFSRLVLSGLVAAATLAASNNSLAGEDSTGATQKPAAHDNDAEWSESVNGLQGRISFKHRSVFNGTPIVSNFLHLRDVSDVLNVNGIQFCWPAAKTTYRLTDAAGKGVKLDRSMSYDGPGQIKTDVVIPWEGTLSFNISGQGLGIPGDMLALLDLAENSFVIPPDAGPCNLRIVIEIADDKKTDVLRSWHGRLELPPVAIPMKVEQPDPAKVAELIRQLGTTMLSGKGSVPEKATRELSLIADERVIPWYVQAMDASSYELKFAALDRLSRFDGDEAFAVLKKESPLMEKTSQAAALRNWPRILPRMSVLRQPRPWPAAERQSVLTGHAQRRESIDATSGGACAWQNEHRRVAGYAQENAR